MLWRSALRFIEFAALQELCIIQDRKAHLDTKVAFGAIRYCRVIPAKDRRSLHDNFDRPGLLLSEFNRTAYLVLTLSFCY